MVWTGMAYVNPERPGMDLSLLLLLGVGAFAAWHFAGNHKANGAAIGPGSTGGQSLANNATYGPLVLPHPQYVSWTNVGQ